jgi:aldehyde dehydrogenase family 7 protein A1
VGGGAAGWRGSGGRLVSVCPSTGEALAGVAQADAADYEAALAAMDAAKRSWAATPAPARGDIVRRIGDALRAKKAALGALVSLEMGKILSEGLGEVQEFIDVCDMAAGMSRTIAGGVLPSERPGHTLLETWNPLGHVAIITAFNFPCAVFGWNVAISLIAGNCNIWKGASTTPLVTLATMKIVAGVLEAAGAPPGVVTCVVGPGRTVGELMLHDKRLPLVSFTGSSEIGRHVSEAVHSRFGRTILELGGNNATVVMPDANMEMALRASVFGAVGTAGQRCTSLRRLLVHEAGYDAFVARLVAAYKTITPGDPLAPGTLLGPLHTRAAVKEFTDGLATIAAQGGVVLAGGAVYADRPGNYVAPTLVAIDHAAPVVQTELFVPILYVCKFATFEQAVAMNNGVPQGLSSSLFTSSMQLSFAWVGPGGSDCGIANVNCGTSGAEIGGAFGGEKETGGGRESGSDSWKQYMRRGTCTINHSDALPLAQGVKFDI